MTVHFRKSMSTGPLRFNLSKSGIGVSAGVRGLRVGTGPRGGYVHAGRGGFQYRQTLGRTAGASEPPVELPVAELDGDSLEGASVSELIEASPNDIVNRISTAASLRKPRLFPNPFTYRQRKLTWQGERAVPLFYELDDDLVGPYSELVAAGDELAASPGRYYDQQSERLDERAGNKGHGGAGSLIDRVDLTVRCSAPPAVTLNFEPLEFAGGRRSLYLLPDLILLRQDTKYAALEYQSVAARVARSRFLTTAVPAGVTPVDTTWKYVNKSGKPDQRYKDNPTIPIIAISEIDFIGPHGFEFHTAFTNSAAVDRFASAYDTFVGLLPAT